MEQVAKCKSLVAIFRDDKKMLDGPHAVGFDIEKDKAFHIDVEQCGIRKISITSDVDVSVFDLYALFSRIERLLMLFDGAFLYQKFNYLSLILLMKRFYIHVKNIL